MKQYSNPYNPAADPETHVRVQARVPISELNKLRVIYPMPGLQETTISILFEKLIQFLYERNITTIADLERYKLEVANCRIVSGVEGQGSIFESGSKFEPHGNSLRGTATAMANSKTSERNDSRGTDSGSSQVETPQGQPTDAPGRTKSRGGGRSGNKKGTEEKG